MSPDLPERSGPPEEPDDLAELLRGLFGQLSTPGAAAGEVPEELREMLAQIPGMPTDPAAMQAVFSQVQRLAATSHEGPVNWTAARDVARQVAGEGGDPSVGQAQQRQVAEALRTADLWLDRVTELSSIAARTEAWSRAEWVEQTLPTWKGVVEPIAESVADAISSALLGQMDEQVPAEMRAAVSQALPMLRSLSGSFFGVQVGQAIGALAREVVGGGDVGLPLLPGGRAALLPVNVAAFGEGLELPEDEVRLYLALREAAFARLVAGVPWLRGHMLAAVTDYARGITIDTDRIESALQGVDPTDPEALQAALGDGLFDPVRTEAQQAALDRLETSLALVEGWVDEVTHVAASSALPHASALRETLRRRRASGGPAEHTFASLVGLELRPRRLREAAAVWAALTTERGPEGRDALWRHPDLVPSETAFEDPVGFARQREDGPGDAMDAALAALLDEAGGDRDE